MNMYGTTQFLRPMLTRFFFKHFYMVYFISTWCPPCRQIKPIYEELSKKYENVKFAKIDVDDNPDASLEYSISAVPTFIFFDGESQVNHFAGADPSKLESMVQDLEGR